MQHAHRIAFLIAALTVGWVVGGAQAAPSSLTATRVSAAAPLPAIEACSGDAETESDPTLSVDPRDRRRVVAAWVQGEDRAIVTASSKDAGRTWSAPRMVPGLTQCSGGEMPYVAHPHVAFAPDGSTYLAAFSRDLPSGVAARTLVSRSTDGGNTWTLVTRPDLPPVDVVNDYDAFAVEPDTGALLVVWSPAEVNAIAETTVLARSTDKGQTWTQTVVRAAAPGTAAWSRIVARPDGTLTLVVLESPLADIVSPSPVEGTVLAVTSTDKGRTWSAPVHLGPAAALHWPAATLGGDRTLYVAWVQAQPNGVCRRLPPDGSSGGSCQIVVRQSTDGITWSASSVASRWSGEWMPTPALAVSDTGTVALVHTRPRSTTPAGHADVLVTTRSADGTWRSEPAGEVDLAKVPYGAPGLGLYQGGVGSQCAASAAAVRTEGAVGGSTDVFVIRAGCPASGRGPH
jgi:hypothetical protein